MKTTASGRFIPGYPEQATHKKNISPNAPIRPAPSVRWRCDFNRVPAHNPCQPVQLQTLCTQPQVWFSASSAPLHPHLDPQLGLSTARSCSCTNLRPPVVSHVKSYNTCCRHCQSFGHQTYCRGLHSFPHFGLVPVARYIHTRRNTIQNHRPTKSAKLAIDHHSYWSFHQ